MPHVINGIGTWYYGKKNVHRLRNVCDSCSALATLESYDTRLYFVVLFIPLIPLRRLRILDSCPSCNRHRLVPLGQWERAKADAVAEARDRLDAAPADREALVDAMRVAAGFQDADLFDAVTEAVSARRGNDAELLATFADINGYFARHRRAAEAYRDSIEVADDPRVRERLGLARLRLGDPLGAEECFAHIYAEGDAADAWMPYQLAVAYQAEGLHADALATIDRVFEAFPRGARRQGLAEAAQGLGQGRGAQPPRRQVAPARVADRRDQPRQPPRVAGAAAGPPRAVARLRRVAHLPGAGARPSQAGAPGERRADRVHGAGQRRAAPGAGQQFPWSSTCRRA